MALQYHWQNFMARDDKRMLVWQFKENALRLAEVFFKVQQEELLQDRPYACDETFIVFDQPFENSPRYAAALKKSLAEHYEASREAIEQASGVVDWPYTHESLPDSPQAFVQGLNALAQHHESLLRTLVAVVMPSSVSSEAAWNGWLMRALEAGPAPQVRLIVTDVQEYPRNGVLVDSGHAQLHVEPIPIDAIELASETFAQEPAVGAAGVLRNLVTGLFNLLDKGTPEQVVLKAEDAIAFARANGMPEQEVVARLMTAGAMQKAQRYDEAVTHYRYARLSAEKLQETDHPAARDLILQGWFGEASAHFAAQNLPETIRCYQEAEPVAEAIPKPIHWIESLRMSAYCHRLIGDDEAALQCCQRAFQVGERMHSQARVVTLLPLVGMELLSILDRKLTHKLTRIKQKLDADLTRSYEAMEQSASRLEQNPNARDALSGLDANLEVRCADLELKAGQAIEKLLQAGKPRYIETCEYIRSVLWDTWPLDRPQSAQEEPPRQEEPASVESASQGGAPK
ncbi:MAG: hypothetical protein P8171_26015 [Candidatus Thiodiazotropha sp.]